MASTAALAKRQDQLERLMKEVMRQCEIATRAYAEDREPLEQAVGSIRGEIRARFDGLDDRIMKLEGRK